MANARGIVLAHNHPSGNKLPSRADIDMTGKIKEGGSLLGIEVFDHIIITWDNGYYSFADQGIL
ncbi:JAB domain-containing protein [Pedobacter fastidiosus]|uniref:JAB domain-containing protein n=1 Tax=Pedobacter fastidiosus TaxID=2765361 RepID=UPI002006FDEF